MGGTLLYGEGAGKKFYRIPVKSISYCFDKNYETPTILTPKEKYRFDIEKKLYEFGSLNYTRTNMGLKA